MLSDASDVQLLSPPVNNMVAPGQDMLVSEAFDMKSCFLQTAFLTWYNCRHDVRNRIALIHHIWSMNTSCVTGKHRPAVTGKPVIVMFIMLQEAQDALAAALPALYQQDDVARLSYIVGLITMPSPLGKAAADPSICIALVSLMLACAAPHSCTCLCVCLSVCSLPVSVCACVCLSVHVSCPVRSID